MNDYDGIVKIVTELETKSIDGQIAKLEKNLERMVSTLKEDAKVPISLKLTEEEKLNLISDVEKTKNRILSLRESMADTGDEGSKMGEKTTKSIKKGVSSLKKFALSLFSIQSIYRLVSRASSAWLSQDTELAQKLQNVWLGLGALVSPVIEKISDLMLKALGYLNEFVKALSGGRIDFIAKANAKALEKQTKAQKELNRQTYDFDEIRKQQEQNAGASTGISGGGISIPELDNRIVKKLQDLAKWLRENQELVKGLGIAFGVSFGAYKIASLLSNIGKLIGVASAGTGLAGLGAILGTLAQIGVIAIGVSLLYTGLTGRDLINDLKEAYNGIKALNEIEQEQREANKKLLEDSLTIIEATNEELEKEGNSQERINQLEDIKKDNVEDIKKYLEDWQILYGLSEDEIKRINDALKDDKTSVDDIKKGINDWSSGISSAKSGLSVFFEGLKSGWNGFKESWNNLFNGGSKGKKAYALGGIVTQPTRALIGEAGYPEAVVPMTGDYLSTLASEIGKYGGGSGGGIVNVYLDGRLIQREMTKTRNNKNFNTNGG
ncbi:MAG: hypothetical protein PUJ51_22245 [Clostridiales bacterium]|uniref:hypothetical protein n=1 Tax=Terrisporobacter sp. TaxID=1965305 RepID=UPI002A54D1EE|nr:hypothetical protein [Terrisporobacter sp.]MDD7757177.1 hypothetical protein [Clostridiales bacterium]MDY4137693.1 hypothetical protein [Terrisporobacter sp.]